MTPDLQARIEAAARELAHKLNRNYARIIANNPDHVRPKAIIIESLTTLAEQIISEKDAEAAGMREAIRLRLQSVSLVLREGRQRQPGNQYVSDAVWHGWIHERKVLDELLEIELPTAGRDLLAEVERLRGEVAAMRHDLETSQGLYACDNAEGQSLFVLDHPSIHYCNQESKSSTTTT